MFDRVPVTQLRPHPRNYRRHPAAQIRVLGESLRRFGQRKPVRAWRGPDGVALLLAGHGVWEAACAIGAEFIDVWWCDGSEEDALHLLVADNETRRLGAIDNDQLAELLTELQAAGDLSITGWADGDLAKLLATIASDAARLPGDDNDPPALAPVIHSGPGVVYELGPHRLVCGDSEDPAVWAMLFGDDAQIDVIWTDPPYGVAYVGGPNPTQREAIQNDNLGEPQLEMLLRRALGAAFVRLAAHGCAYVASPARASFRVFARVLVEHGWSADMQWIKTRLTFGRADFHYQHEPVFYCGPAPVPEKTEFVVARPSRSLEHPTMKPTELIAAGLAQSARPGAMVCDPFGGSGSTLIAAATERMVARTIELDPAYADVIRRRWTRWARANGFDPGTGALEDA